MPPGTWLGAGGGGGGGGGGRFAFTAAAAPAPAAAAARRAGFSSYWFACSWISFATSSGLRTSLKRLWPSLPPDSISRSPAPIMRSQIDCLKFTFMIRSRGISTPDFAIIPCRNMTRSLVTVKLVVVHFE